MKNKMLFFLSLPLVLSVVVITRLINVSEAQKQEFDFHTNIPHTIRLVSEDFPQNGRIPLECSGKGENIVPSLSWSPLPEGTRSLVLLMTDYDGPAPFLKLNTVDHWVVYNIPPTLKGFPKGVTTGQLQKDGIRFGENFTKGIDYAGPKPPVGVHRYFFRIYALSTPALNLTNPKKQELMYAMKSSILAYGELIGKF